MRYNKGQRRESVLGRANKADPQNYGVPLAQMLRCHEQFVNGFAQWSPCFAVPVWLGGAVNL